jgi:hypothetical protein
MKMARSVVFHLRDGASWKATSVVLSAGKATLAVDSVEVSWWAELLGEADVQLALVGSETAPQVAVPPAPLVLAPTPPLPPPAPPLVTASSSGAPVRTASYFVLGGAVVAAGAGAIFGVKSSAAFSQIDKVQRDGNGVITGLTETQAQALGTGAARDGTVANACFIGAGALAVGGALMWWLGAPVAVAAGPGGVVVSGRLP